MFPDRLHDPHLHHSNTDHHPDILWVIAFIDSKKWFHLEYRPDKEDQMQKNNIRFFFHISAKINPRFILQKNPDAIR
tara:strand:+ start:459 stop:689 length:231 start_codon:yes stop_codon:yes gene_type:complete